MINSLCPPWKLILNTRLIIIMMCVGDQKKKKSRKIKIRKLIVLFNSFEYHCSIQYGKNVYPPRTDYRHWKSVFSENNALVIIIYYQKYLFTLSLKSQVLTTVIILQIITRRTSLHCSRSTNNRHIFTLPFIIV